MKMVSIWIDKKDKARIINDIQDYDELECESLYEGHDIGELYIDRHSGAIEGYIGVGPIGIGIDLPFQDWFTEFLRFGAFEDLEYFLAEHQDEVKKAYMILKNIRSLSEKANKEVSE